MTLTPDMLPPDGHGTNGYVHYRCRCEICSAANRQRSREQRARRIASPTPERVHGTIGGYSNYGCRCEACTAAHSASLSSGASYRRRGRASGAADPV